MSLTLEEARYIARQLPDVTWYHIRMLHSSWLTDEVWAEVVADMDDVDLQRLITVAGVRYKDYRHVTELPRKQRSATSPARKTVTVATVQWDINAAMNSLLWHLKRKKPVILPEPAIKQLTCPHCGKEVQVECQVQKPDP